MKRITCIAAVVTAVTFPAAAFAQAPPGYYYAAQTVMLPDSLTEVSLGGRFQISVTRVVGDSVDRALIEEAERLVPVKGSIESAATAIASSGDAHAFEEASSRSGDRWWWRDWDGTLLPFALTASAVDHYIERVRNLSAQPNPFAKYNPGVRHRASMQYTARVRRTTVESAPFQVELNLRFAYSCGRLCALYFTHSRTVEFDARGRAVRVVGDRPPAYVES